MAMKTKCDRLLDQFQKVQQRGQRILAASGLSSLPIIYAFATEKTLVINCRDEETTWLCSENQSQLWKSILELKSSIDQIVIEKGGKVWYSF
jgi:hypothetical protein